MFVPGRSLFIVAKVEEYERATECQRSCIFHKRPAVSVFYTYRRVNSAARYGHHTGDCVRIRIFSEGYLSGAERPRYCAEEYRTVSPNLNTSSTERHEKRWNLGFSKPLEGCYADMILILHYHRTSVSI